MQGQRGFTLITLIFLLGLAVLVAWLAFKVVPVYMDYYAIKNSLANILDEDSSQSNEGFRKTFEARMNVNFIRDITARDLEIERDGGMVTLSVPISRQAPLAGGVSLLIELKAEASVAQK